MLLVVAAALVNAAGLVLLQRRPDDDPSHPGAWEFPGGKVEPGENVHDALIRELREELGIGMERDDLEPVCFSAHGNGRDGVLLLLFLCRAWDGMPTPLPGWRIAWVNPRGMEGLSMPPADIPLLAPLRRLL